jgi:hypothetical protein
VKAFLCLLCAFALTGCGIRQMSGYEKAVIHARQDTIYVLPARADFRHKGILLSRHDLALEARTARLADSILAPELVRRFPGLIVARAEPGFIPGPSSRAVTVACEVRAYRRTLPREVLSSLTDVVLMVPTFAFNLGYPLTPSSRVRLHVSWPNGRVLRLKHGDDVEANLPADLGFQIRKLLDPDWRS